MRHDLVSSFCPVDYQSVIDNYCRLYGISAQDLRRKCRIYKGIHIDYLRMCLGYYLKEELKLPPKVAGISIGYSGHAAVSRYSKIMKNYIEAKDPYLFPHWENLKKVEANTF